MTSTADTPGSSAADPSRDAPDASTPPQRARRLIDAGQDMTLATAGPDGTPWVSPVFYVPDERYDLFWTSERTARHSANVRATGAAAIVIYAADASGRVDAVYMQAEAAELTDPAEITRAIAVMSTKSQPERWAISGPGDVSGEGPWRIYRAHPTTVDVRATATRNGKAVARREPAEFRPGV